MKYILGLFFGVQFFIFLFPSVSFADVKINEVAWMGTAASQYSEWIELYNNGGEAVSLAGWKLYKTGDELLFTLSKTIAAGGYLLVERTTATAPDAVAGINDEAGTFGAGGLRNGGEDLSLKDKDGNSIDSLSFASGWPAGDAKTKDTMQWNGQQWITAPGTPDALNAKTAIIAASSSPDPTTTAAQNQTQSPVTTPVTVEPVPAVTPVITVPVPTTENTPDNASETAPVPATTLPEPTPVAVVTTTEVPVPDKAAPLPSTSNVPVPATTTVKKTTSAKKTTNSTASSSSASTAGDTATNDAAADQLQASANAPTENNHTKIIILAAVAFIGMALFLLLMRFKARQE